MPAEVIMVKLPKLMFSDPAEIRAFRKKHDIKQLEFWHRIGVTQSAGSRYENGRNLPDPVRLLLHLAYAPDDRAQRLSAVLRAWKAPKSPKAASGSSR